MLLSPGQVSTVNMDGSAWSWVTVFIAQNLDRSYLNGARFPCQAATSKGEWRWTAEKRRPWYLLIICGGSEVKGSNVVDIIKFVNFRVRNKKSVIAPLFPGGRKEKKQR